MTASIRRFCFLLAVLSAFPLAAQDRDERITRLESQLALLLEQASAIRKELDEIKGSPAGDLLTVEPLTEAASGEPSPAADEAPPIASVQPLETQPSASGLSRALNPDVSVVGTLAGRAGAANPFDGATLFEPDGGPRSPVNLEEVEIAFEAFIDPYAKGRFFLSVGEHGAEIEEGYAQFVTLPHQLTAKAGRMKASFGKANTWHTHTRPWIDQPLMVQRFFGEEGFADSGISVSRPIDNPWGAFIEATAEVFSGDSEGIFAREASNDLAYNAHLKFYRDVTENSNIEAGTSWSTGTLARVDGAGGRNRFTGIDVTYRWKPLSRSIYNSFAGRIEALANRRADSGRTLYGVYAAGDYQISRRWYTGVRIDRADRSFVLGEGTVLPDTRFTDRSVSATLTFRPSEFSQLRGQLRRTSYGRLETVNELLFQLQFAIGAHGAHPF